jgi:hypothetical protein
LVLLGGSAAGASLLAMTGNAFAETTASDRQARIHDAIAAVLGSVAATPLAAVRKATQTGFSPINSSLTFGAPTDLAAGWDGTVWAIDQAGAPHIYDPLSQAWQLHGTGIDGAALIDDAGPAVYFRGGEVFFANGPQSTAQAIGSVWPALPQSYQLGVKGAAWAAGKLVLFRGGTYLTVPWPLSTSVYHAALQPAGTVEPTQTRLPIASATAVASMTPMPTETRIPTATARVVETATPTPTSSTLTSPTPTSTASATGTPTVTQLSTATPAATPAATATPDPPDPELPADYATSPLSGISGWPQTANWLHGVLDGVYSQGDGVVLLIHGGEFVTLTFSVDAPPVASGPTPLSQHASFAQLPPDWSANGFDAGFFTLGGPAAEHVFAFKGPLACVYPASVGAESRSSALDQSDKAPPRLGASVSATPFLYYIVNVAGGDWPATWHPQLAHAPSGRSSNLWAATVDGRIVSFDGATTGWTQQPGDAVSVAAGSDGSVFAVGKQNPAQLSQWTGGAWNPVATHSAPLSQVAVGNQNVVWTRDTGSAVHQLASGQLQPAAFVGASAHLAANSDGTLWSCSGADPVASRFASELGVAQGSVQAAGNVQKVASTGFGTAHCLAENQLYRYDSPYAFRSAGSYTFATNHPIEQGLGRLYFVAQMGDTTVTPFTYQVVAMDAHTGVELSRSAVSPTGLQYTPPAFDPIHQTVIVGLATAGGASTSQPGQLMGLDAQDLSKVLWTINLPGIVQYGWQGLGPGRPTLSSTQLCVSDNYGSVVMYDTGAGPAPTMPTHSWTYIIGGYNAQRMPPPVVANGIVYALSWIYFGTPDSYLQLWLSKFDAATGAVVSQTVLVQALNVDNPTNTYAWTVMGLYPPLLATISSPQAGQSSQMLFIDGGISVLGVDVNALTVQTYNLPGADFGSITANLVNTGFGFADGVVWFGDKNGNLYGLDGLKLTAVPNTPAALGTGVMSTTPLPYTDTQGDATILCSLGANSAGLVVFDPTSGGQVTIQTQGTGVTTLSRLVTNGVVYAGGGAKGNTAVTTQTYAQVFAIRVDEAIQDLRSVIVDSQLMQDFDDPSQPTHNANGQSRYQTHLTLVGDQKAPLVNEPVKIWADRATTILVNGQTYSIGPDDTSFAALQTGTDGALVIMSGYTQANGSDKTDMSASPLRVWAGFMDPYERMLIYPDREHHNRIATAHATDPTQTGADDPTRINLQTAQKYGDLPNQGKNPSSAQSLFTAQQKSDNQPQQVAGAIQTMTTSVGAAPPPGSKSLKASWALHATDTSGKYIPYANTPGAQYSPYNVAANRTAVVLQPAGFSYSLNGAGTPTYTGPEHGMTPAQAMQAIDALSTPGAQRWETSQHATPRVRAAAAAGTLHLLGDVWDDFWSWIKSVVATITHVIVAVAEDIYVGIRVVVDGVVHVFQAIIAGIEQVASAIGSFFIELGHLIEEVIEALSVLFQFGHIIDTFNLLEGHLLLRINGDGSKTSTTYPGIATLVLGDDGRKITGAVTHVDHFFDTSEATVSNWLNTMAGALSGTPANGMPGGGSTAHSVFAASPSGGGPSSSTATQSTWGLQKFNSGIGAGGAQSVALLANGQRLLGDDPISTFFNNFVTSLTTDPVLSSQWDKVKSGAQGLGNADSAADFVKQGLAELLRILALLIDGVLGVSKALVDGLLAEIASLVTSMFGPDGWLVTTLDFPVLSWLFQTLFGKPLTILNAVLLLVSIPVTILWRIMNGSWPADTVPASPTALGTAPQEVQTLLGISNALISAFLGFIYAKGDAAGDGNVPLGLGRWALAFSVASSAFSVPSYGKDEPTVLDWSAWSLGLTGGLLNVLGSVSFSAAATEEFSLTQLGPALLSGLSVAQMLVLGLEFDQADYGEAPKNPLGNAALALGIVSQLAGLINPLKLESELGAAVVAVVDVIMGFAAAAAGILSLAASSPSSHILTAGPAD